MAGAAHNQLVVYEEGRGDSHPEADALVHVQPICGLASYHVNCLPHQCKILGRCPIGGLNVPSRFQQTVAAAASGVVRSSAGRKTRKVAPRPGWFVTSTRPSCCFTTPQTTASPKPLAVSFVVKKGSKICPTSPGSMPAPVSLTLIQTYVPVGSPAGLPSVRFCTRWVSSATIPPCGIAS
jgi:hypothetical protein